MNRERLPNRRLSTSLTFEHRGLLYTATTAVLLTAAWRNCSSTTTRSTLRPTSIVATVIILSFALQHGADIKAIARALSRDPQGKPTGVVGVAIGLVIAEPQP